MTEHYEAENETIWIETDADGDTLIENSEIQRWIGVLRDGKTQDGRAVRAVNYIFNDPESAEYNHHALSFARVGTFVGTFGSRTPFSDDAPSFGTGEDFGI